MVLKGIPRAAFLFSIGLVFLLSPFAGQAAIIHVPADQPTIQAGIDASTDGDEVVIADGVYTGDGNRDISFQGKAITVRSANGPQTCIIDCGGSSDGLHRGFSFQSDEGNDSVLQGVTVFRGYQVTGGGFYLNGASPVIRHCIIVDCTSTGNGGGMYCYLSSPLIVNCILASNEADIGGAFYCRTSSDPVIVNCSIVGNRGYWKASGIYCYYNSNMTLSNSIVWGNTGGEGEACVCENSSDPTIRYSNIEGGWDGDGNIDADPSFAFDGADLHLLSGSACIDAGSNGLVAAFCQSDLDGNDRVLGGSVDMGAYEFDISEPPSLSLSTTWVRIIDHYGDDSPREATLFLKNRGSGSFSWSASTQAGWLQLDPASGESSGEVDAIQLSADTAGLTAGHYTAEVAIEDVDRSIVAGVVYVELFVGSEIVVEADGSGDYPTIQAAIDAASHGDRISCCPGRYEGEGNYDISFQGKAIMLHGEQGASSTIINGISSSYSHHIFIIDESETEDTIIDGFTLTGHSTKGTCIACIRTSPTIRNCIVRNNFVRANSSRPGTVDDPAGIVQFTNASPVVSNTSIVDNVLDAVKGGGVYSEDYSTPTLTNCTIAFNQITGGECAAIMSGGYSTTTVTNSIVWGNTVDGTIGPDQVNSDYYSSNDLTWSCIEQGWPGEGNIDLDPGFVFPGQALVASNSPCIDSGSNTPGAGLPPDDPDGVPRPLDGDGDSVAIADMGAYEYDPTTPYLAIGDDEIVFSAIAGGDPPEDQTLLIRNAGGMSLGWMITGQPSWLVISPSVGSTFFDDAITLSVDTAGLSRGDYSVELVVSEVPAIHPDKVIAVTLHLGSLIRVPEDHATIQDAIDAAIDWDVVEIADGVYSGVGNRDLDYTRKGITVQSASGDPSACVIDCEHEGRGVYFHTRESYESVLRGVTIINGTAGDGGNYGGGIYISYCSPSIDDCVISGCQATYGGGVALMGSSAKMTHCRVSGNTASSNGGGVYASSYSPFFDSCSSELFDCEIVNNEAVVRGGGLYTSYSRIKLTQCAIHGNDASGESSFGGGMYIYSDHPVLANCSVVGNTASSGGGLYNIYDSNPRISNSILYANLPEQIEKYVSYYNPSNPVVRYSLIQGAAGESWFGEGCIDTDPMLVDMDGADDDPSTWEDNDFRLSAGSPCIDAGSNVAVPADRYDFDGDGDRAEGIPFDMFGNQRFADDPNTVDTGSGDAPVVDMGVYEFQLAGDLDWDGNVDLDDFALFAGCLAGPGVTVPPAGADPAVFALADLDGDGDVDLADYAKFMRLFGGS